jgi:hypothetical protein
MSKILDSFDAISFLKGRSVLFEKSWTVSLQYSAILSDNIMQWELCLLQLDLPLFAQKQWISNYS